LSSSVASPGRGRIWPMQRLRPWTASGRRVPYRSRLPRGNHRQITFLCLGTFVPGILGVTAVVESGKAVKATFWARLIPESAARRASLGDRGFDPHSLQSPRAEWVPFGGTRRLSRRQTNEQASKPKPISRAELKFRIQSPRAVSQQTFGSSQDARCSTRCPDEAPQRFPRVLHSGRNQVRLALARVQPRSRCAAPLSAQRDPGDARTVAPAHTRARRRCGRCL